MVTFDGGRTASQRITGRGHATLVNEPLPPDDTVQAPRRLKDRYSLGPILGRGSLGTTYRAHDHLIGRAVAVKVVSDRYADDTLFAERFMAAAAAAGRLVHPHIVTVLDAGLVDGKPFVVTELVEGHSLREHLTSRGMLSVQECESIATQLADAIAAAHRQRVVHGDVRPENILLDERGTAKLTDFGFVRAAVSTDLTLIGTVQRAAYLPPEHPVRDTADAQVDLYGLGAVLYEMLTGQTPRAAVADDGANGLVRSAPPPVRRRRADVSARLERTVSRALSPNPRDRFTSAQELRQALAGQERQMAAQAASVPMTAMAAPAPAPVGAPAWRSEPRRRRQGGGPGVGNMIVGLIPLIATVALLGGAGLLLTGFLPRMFTNLQITDVPSLVDYDLSEATSIAEAFGLNVKVANTITTDDRARGSVISQDPQPDKRVRKGNEIKLTISAGIRPPNVVGKPVDEARAILVRAGWTIGDLETKSDVTEPVGTVVESRPGPEEPATSRQQPVALIVSGGNAPAPAPAAAPPTGAPAATTNLAANRPVRLSNQQPYPGVIVDGSAETFGVVNLPAPYWVEIDLAQPSTVAGVELVSYLERPGDTVYEVWVWTADNQFRGMHTFVGPTRDGQTQTIRFPQAVGNVRAVRVVTTQAAGASGWRDIRVLGQ